ncbi:putative nuclease HARBI1 [Dermacentor andersoni]|uniref:putative nuclease HARBI1 n=1 Tax=Dermacentor andersoni TaxID=34620 RepID=UPI003B3B1B27
MAQSAVSSTIHEVTEAIISASARRRLVDFPFAPSAKDEAKAAFARRGAIPGVLACVDGTLIAIMKPEGLSPADTASFMPRKGYYALNVMVVCNAKLRILVVDPRFPGSCHDSWRFKTLLYSPDRAARIIYACVALHNIALDAGDWTLDDYGGEVPPAEEPEEPGDIQVLAPHDVFPQRKAAAQRRCQPFLKDTGMVRSDVLRCGAHLLQDLA